MYISLIACTQKKTQLLDSVYSFIEKYFEPTETLKVFLFRYGHGQLLLRLTFCFADPWIQTGTGKLYWENVYIILQCMLVSYTSEAHYILYCSVC